jgi:hypothetical protein
VVEDDERRVQLLRGAQDLADLAAAGVELRVRAAAPAPDHAVAPHAGAFDQAHHLLDAFLVAVVAEIQADDDRRLGIGGAKGKVLQGRFLQPTRRPCRLPG